MTAETCYECSRAPGPVESHLCSGSLLEPHAQVEVCLEVCESVPSSQSCESRLTTLWRGGDCLLGGSAASEGLALSQGVQEASLGSGSWSRGGTLGRGPPEPTAPRFFPLGLWVLVGRQGLLGHRIILGTSASCLLSPRPTLRAQCPTSDSEGTAPRDMPLPIPWQRWVQ